MTGTIKSFLPEKRYGFITGDNGREYFFHENSLQDRAQLGRITAGCLVEFEERKTSKGYRASGVNVLNPAEIDRYVCPEAFLVEKGKRAPGWEVLEMGNWLVSGSSKDSSEAAKRQLIDRAQSTGANSVLYLEYFKATGSGGSYRFTIHNYRGRIASVGKKSLRGTFSGHDLIGINDKARSLKEELTEKTQTGAAAKYAAIKTWLWFAGIFALICTALSLAAFFYSDLGRASFAIAGLGLLPLIAVIVIGFFIRPSDPGFWLIESPAPQDDNGSR